MRTLELLEHSLRQLFERLGAKLDLLVSGGAQQSASVRSMLIRLSPMLQRAVDDNLRQDEGVNLAPHRLRVLLDYDSYSQLSQPSIRRLKQELIASAKDYINDRQYRLSQPLALTLTYDPIASSPIVRADFGDSALSSKAADQISSTDVCYRLRSVSGPVAISIDLKNLKQGGDPVTIGRGHDNAVVIDDKSVSKFHATLAMNSEGRLFVADCGSMNGTFLNGQAVSRRSEITPGDVLSFGDVELRLERVE